MNKTLALIALLAFAASDCALARGKHGGGRSHGHSASAGHARSSVAAPHRGFSGRARIGIFAGAPVFAAPFYYPPYYYGTPGYYNPAPPVQYIEQFPDPQTGTPAWYYCPEAGAYCPYVQACPGGWEQVAGQTVTPPAPPAY